MNVRLSEFLSRRPNKPELAAIGLLVWISILSPVYRVLDVELDPSWQVAISHFFLKGLQEGKDYFFSYGPLGLFQSGVFDESLFWKKFIWEIVTKLALTGSFVWLVSKASRSNAWTLCVFAAALLTWSPNAMWVLCLWWTVALLFENELEAIFEVLIGFFFALVALSKFNLFIITTMGAFFLVAARKGRRSSSFVLCGFVIGIPIIWLLCGQNILNLPSYLTSSWNLSQGFLSGLALAGSALELRLAVLIGVIFAFLLSARVLKEGFKIIVFVVWTSFLLFCEWKHGFVRHDAHSMTFFTFCLFVALSRFTVSARDEVQRPFLLLGTLAVFLCLLGIRNSMGIQFASRMLSTPERLCLTVRRFVEPRELYQKLALRELKEMEHSPISNLSARIGAATVDIFSYSVGALFLSGLRPNYVPRPAFQSYLALTPFLAAQNQEFYRGMRSPDYVIVNLTPVDNHFPMLEDGRTFVEIMADYKWVLKENGYFLFERQSQKNQELERAKRDVRMISFGDELTLTDAVFQAISIQIKYSLLGKLRNFFFRPPPVHIDVWNAAGDKKSYVMPPSLAISGFLLNPFVEETQDLELAVNGKGKRITRVVITVQERHQRYFQNEIVVALDSANGARAIADALMFP